MLIDLGAALAGSSVLCFFVLLIGLAKAAARPAPQPATQTALTARASGPRIANTHRAHGHLPAPVNLPR